MGFYQPIAALVAGNNDRVVAALVAGLEREFGCGAVDGLARRFLAAEEIDFRWDARCEERWLGAYETRDDADCELDRIAIWGRLDGQWFTAVMLVDGEGNAHGMTGCRLVEDRLEARNAMLRAR